MEVLSVQEQLLDHESRIKTLENNYDKFIAKVTAVENGQIQLENTVLKTSQGQNELLNTLITNTFDLKKTKTISRKEIIIAGIGSGGVLGIIVGGIIKFL